MEKVVKTFRSVAQVPSISAGRILNCDLKNKSNPSQVTIYSWWSQRCLERGKTVKYQQTHLVDTCTKDVIYIMPIDSSNEIISSFSPNEESRAVIREIPSSQENSFKKSQHLEIWRKSSLDLVVDLTALDVHGDVYADIVFSCFEWSPCEKKLLYIAEKKTPKSEPFYKTKAQSGKDDSGSGDNKITKGDEYIYKEEWGEQLVGKHQPVVAVYDFQEEKITVLDGIPDNLSPGQAIWAPDGGIVGVAWENDPRRLGLIYCTNRPSYVFHLIPNGIFRVLSQKSGNSVRSPRFSPDGKKLIWLERPAGGPHEDAHRLVKYCWSTGKIEIVVDIVDNKMDGVDPLRFRGLYDTNLPKNCWSSDSVHIVLSTPGPTCKTSCLINSDNKKITLLNITDDDAGVGGNSSLSILDFKNDLILCARSNLKYPHCLIIGKFPSGDISSSNGEDIDWLPVTSWKCFAGLKHVESITYYTNASSNVTPNLNEINALCLMPRSDPGQKVPVIIYPHGGPHSNFINSFSIDPAFFALLGYGVVMVNYRGSTGFGKDYVNFLLGKIGDSDVKDVNQVAEELCNFTSTNFDPSRRVLFGGSHGGFLVTHLSGQYPGSYKAVAARNPVCDISPMPFLTDIPDWCAVESGFPYSAKGDISRDDFIKMYDASPIRYADQVTAPTLLLIGKKDLRVPCAQGLEYYHKLKANNIKTKLLVYDDNHPLGLVPVHMDAIINTALWFDEHVKKDS